MDVELSSVRRIAGRDLITVTNTFTDAAGERVHTLHTTVVGVTPEDVDPAIKEAVEGVIMHDVNMLGVDEFEAGIRRPPGPMAKFGSRRKARPARRGRRRSMT